MIQEVVTHVRRCDCTLSVRLAVYPFEREPRHACACREKVREELLEHGLLSCLRDWLRPIQLGREGESVLPNTTVREALYNLLEAVRTSGCHAWVR